jgi:acyl-CoA synthetase (AMP-forming)/AMP-acid ligase II
VDRVKDMIVTGNASSNVYCRPIEDVLAAHPQVRAAAVIGVPHEQVGEAVHAFVVAAPGATLTGEQLRQHVTGELNELWSPREVTFVDALPLTESGKVDKVALRHRYLAASLVREESARPETAAGNSGHSEQQPPPPARGASPATASTGVASTQPHSRTTLSP